MKIEDIKQLSERNIKRAQEIISELKIHQIWKDLDSTCHLIGSVETGLLLNKLDIDFHVYSKEFSIQKSFQTIAQIAENPKIIDVTYKNLLEADDNCIEWHLWYKDSDNQIWTIDMMHIRNESIYTGVIERITQKIKSHITEKQREIILQIKWEAHQLNEVYNGIEIYEAVMDHRVNNLEEFKCWLSNHKLSTISLWEPGTN